MKDVFISLTYEDPDSESPEVYFRVVELETDIGKAKCREQEYACGAFTELADFLEV